MSNFLHEMEVLALSYRLREQILCSPSLSLCLSLV